MKRYTKKGPRRSRAMPVSSKRFVVTDYDGCRYITAGKAYKRDQNSPWSFGITDDRGRAMCISNPGYKCAHLDDTGVWRWAVL